VQDAGELAYAELESRLSRSGAKETTLDYAKDFAERRGIAEAFGVRSEIELAAAQKLAQDVSSRAAHRAQEQQDWAPERQHAAERAGSVRREDPAQDLTHGIGSDRPQHQAEKPEPLVPAITRHDRSIQDVAREKAMPVFQQRFEAVESVARQFSAIHPRSRAGCVPRSLTRMATAS
jgi:hypothetical protein